MKYFLGLVAVSILNGTLVLAETKETSLFLAYPPPEHETTAEKIFLIGTASPMGKVTINGESIDRSNDGHFAPSFPSIKLTLIPVCWANSLYSLSSVL